MRSFGLHKRQDHKTNRREQRYRRCSFVLSRIYCCYSNKIVAVIGGVRLNGLPGKLRPSKIFTLKPISCEKRLRLMPRQNPRSAPLNYCYLLRADPFINQDSRFPIVYLLPGPKGAPVKVLLSCYACSTHLNIQYIYSEQEF